MTKKISIPHPDNTGDGSAKENRKTRKIDDGFYSELADGACLEGYMGIPSLMNLNNTEIPSRLVPFNLIDHEIAQGDTSGYVHFYIFDEDFEAIITDTETFVDKLLRFDGALTPDCSLLTGQVNCLQAACTFHNRAVGFYLQKKGVPIIPHVRWSDEASYDYCFLGVPKHSTVAISTYGAIKDKRSKQNFRNGLLEMIDRLSPTDVVVHGRRPKCIFEGIKNLTNLHPFDDWTTTKHKKGGDDDGSRL